MPSHRELLRSMKGSMGLKCQCPARCKYCGAKRKLDVVGHYCPTVNCDWQHGYRGCTLFKNQTSPSTREEKET